MLEWYSRTDLGSSRILPRTDLGSSSILPTESVILTLITPKYGKSIYFQMTFQLTLSTTNCVTHIFFIRTDIRAHLFGVSTWNNKCMSMSIRYPLSYSMCQQ